MDILIPLLFICGYAAGIIYSNIKDPHRKRRKEDPKEKPKFTHPPMDLRLKKEE